MLRLPLKDGWAVAEEKQALLMHTGETMQV